jgi:hypothetical protein
MDITPPPAACPEPCADHERVAAARAYLLDDTTYVDLAEIFRALGDATRAKIVFNVSSG